MALAPSLDLPGRVAVLGACLSPLAYGVFDNSLVRFHPELCYPPLALLLALDLREGRSRRAVLAAALVVLVKEDGAVLCASILVAFFALRLRALGSAAPAHERRRVVATAVRSLAVLGLVFVAGMVLLWAMGRALPEGQLTAESRVLDSLRNVVRAVEGRGLLRDNLRSGLVGYLVVGLLTLLTLGRRLPRGLALLVASSPLLVSVLVVASGTYRFRYMLWPHRLAALHALAIACVALAAPAAAWVGRRGVARLLSLVALSWTLQVVVLDRAEGYSPWARLWAPALMKGEGTRAAGLPPAELHFLRCLAGRLPPGMPVSSTGDLHPVFHRQSVVFEAVESQAWHPPRLRVVPASSAPRDPAFCRDPGRGGSRSGRGVRPPSARGGVPRLARLVEPRRAVGVQLLLPDRHLRLERVDREAAGGERLGAVRRRDRHRDARLADLERAEAMDEPHQGHGKAPVRLGGDLLHQRQCHLLEGLVLEAQDRAAAVLVAHHAHEQAESAVHRRRRLQRCEVDRIAHEAD